MQTTVTDTRFGVASPTMRPSPYADMAPAGDGDNGAPPPRRRRWWSLAVLVAVVLAGLGVLAGRLTAPGPGVSVVVLRHGLAAGTLIAAGDVRAAHLTHRPAGALSATSAVVGRTALRTLPGGTVVMAGDVGPAVAVPTVGKALVGVFVQAGQAPAEPLQPGDLVTVVQPPQDQGGAAAAPHVLAYDVVVAAVDVQKNGEAVTLAVPADLAVTLSGHAAVHDVALVLVAAPG